MGDVINFFSYARPYDNGDTVDEVFNDLKGSPVLRVRDEAIDNLLEMALVDLACSICTHIANGIQPDISIIQDYKIKITDIMEIKNEA